MKRIQKNKFGFVKKEVWLNHGYTVTQTRTLNGKATEVQKRQLIIDLHYSPIKWNNITLKLTKATIILFMTAGL
jgi:hypothetical protein